MFEFDANIDGQPLSGPQALTADLGLLSDLDPSGGFGDALATVLQYDIRTNRLGIWPRDTGASQAGFRCRFVRNVDTIRISNKEHYAFYVNWSRLMAWGTKPNRNRYSLNKLLDRLMGRAIDRALSRIGLR